MIDKKYIIASLYHIKYSTKECGGLLRHLSTEKMVSKYYCEKCGQTVKVIHGRSYNEIKEYEKRFGQNDKQKRFNR